jgi:hypothetical protein
MSDAWQRRAELDLGPGEDAPERMSAEGRSLTYWWRRPATGRAAVKCASERGVRTKAAGVATSVDARGCEARTVGRLSTRSRVP